jgi:hypothetical protein
MFKYLCNIPKPLPLHAIYLFNWFYNKFNGTNEVLHNISQ